MEGDVESERKAYFASESIFADAARCKHQAWKSPGLLDSHWTGLESDYSISYVLGPRPSILQNDD